MGISYRQTKWLTIDSVFHKRLDEKAGKATRTCLSITVADSSAPALSVSRLKGAEAGPHDQLLRCTIEPNSPGMPSSETSAWKVMNTHVEVAEFHRLNTKGLGKSREKKKERGHGIRTRGRASRGRRFNGEEAEVGVGVREEWNQRSNPSWQSRRSQVITSVRSAIITRNFP